MLVDKQIVLEPRDVWWEAGGVFNPGIAEFGGRIYMMYRAVGRDHLSRLGLAVSEDGERFTRFDFPALEADQSNPYERLGLEDPRITKIGRDYYITYTAASVYGANHPDTLAPSLNSPGVPWRVRLSLMRTRDFRTFERFGVVMPEIDTKDGVLFNRQIQGKYWLFHRIVPAIYVSVSNNLRQWSGGFQLLGPREDWESDKIGAACPPIETERGWLLLYHAVDRRKVYSMGAALLDKENPAFVIGRSKEPIMTPTEKWEKTGVVPNVVFATGSLVSQKTVSIYYGAGDKVVGLVKISLDALLESLSRP